jgi:hypothetical protein
LNLAAVYFKRPRAALGMSMTMPNNQNNRPGFFERATVRFFVVAIIVVVSFAWHYVF